MHTVWKIERKKIVDYYRLLGRQLILHLIEF